MRCIRFSPDGNWLAAYATDNSIRLWNARNLQPHVTVSTTDHTGAFAGVVQFSPDSRRLAVGDASGGTIRMIDVATGTELEWESAASSGEATSALKHGGRVADLEFSPDGKLLVSSGHSTEILIWDANTGQRIGTLTGSPRIVDIEFSPDGERLASTNDDGTVDLWNIDEQKRIAALQGHMHRVGAVAYSPDGHVLVSGSDDGQVLVWPTEPMLVNQSYRSMSGKRYPVFLT